MHETGRRAFATRPSDMDIVRDLFFWISYHIQKELQSLEVDTAVSGAQHILLPWQVGKRENVIVSVLEGHYAFFGSGVFASSLPGFRSHFTMA